MKRFIIIWVLILALLAYVLQLIIFIPAFVLLLISSFQHSFSIVLIGASLIAFAETSFSPVAVILLSIIALRGTKKE